MPGAIPKDERLVTWADAGYHHFIARSRTLPVAVAKLFGMEAQTCMNLQAQYDLEIAERELSKQIDKEVTPLPQAA